MHPLLFTSHGCFSELSIHVILAVIFFSGDHWVKKGYHVLWWHRFSNDYGDGLFVIHVIIYRIMFCFVFTFNSLSHCEVISIWTSDCVDIAPVMVSFWPLLVSWLFFIWEILPKYHLCNSQNYAFVNYGDNFSGDIELILVSHLVFPVDLHCVQCN